MNKIVRNLINSILSIITTFLLMAAPVAAVAYSSEPMEANNLYITKKISINQANGMVAKLDWVGDKINELKPDLLNESIVTSLIQIKKSESNYKVSTQ